MTWNKDRKQTIYGHKRREHMTHTTEPWHNSPLPKGSSRALTVPSGRGREGGVGALEAPQDKYGQEHRTGTSRVEQTDRDHGGAGSSGSHGGAGSSGGHGGAGSPGGHGGAGSSGGHGGAGSSGGHGGAGSSGGHGGAGSSGGHGGAGSSGGHGGAGSSGGHGGAGSSGGHGRWSSGALASVPSARPLQPEPLLPPPQKFPWGSQGVSGALRG